MSIKIYFVHYKNIPEFTTQFHSLPHICHVQAGRSRTKTNLNIPSDDQYKDSISHLNDLYCELTFHYQLMKHGPKSNFVGLFQYSRFLNITSHHGRFNSLVSQIPQKEFPYYLNLCLNESILSTLNYDLIIPKHTYKKLLTYQNYSTYHFKKDWDVMMQVIKDKFPKIAAPLITIFHTTKGYRECNMYYTKWSLFEEISNFQFTVLIETYHRLIDYHNKRNLSNDPYQRHNIAFLSERLLSGYFDLLIQTRNISHLNTTMMSIKKPKPIIDQLRKYIFSPNVNI